MDINIHNVAFVKTESIHFEENSQTGAFDIERITIVGSDGKTIVISLYKGV
jgi:hypothetical protein